MLCLFFIYLFQDYTPYRILVLRFQSEHRYSVGLWLGTHDPITPEWSAGRFPQLINELHKNVAEHGASQYQEGPYTPESFATVVE